MDSKYLAKYFTSKTIGPQKVKRNYLWFFRVRFLAFFVSFITRIRIRYFCVPFLTRTRSVSVGIAEMDVLTEMAEPLRDWCTAQPPTLTISVSPSWIFCDGLDCSFYVHSSAWLCVYCNPHSPLTVSSSVFLFSFAVWRGKKVGTDPFSNLAQDRNEGPEDYRISWASRSRLATYFEPVCLRLSFDHR
jgi:hypothetical protein